MRAKLKAGDLTRRQLIYIHRALWRWLAENPYLEKSDWPGWQRRGGRWPELENDCAACEYGVQEQIKSRPGQCSEKCLFKWPGISCMYELSCSWAPGIYKEWDKSKRNIEKRMSLALQIANLPVRRERER